MRIRRIQQGDGGKLLPLITAYLKETYDQGADFLPTPKNATVFTLFAIEGAHIGEPCLVAEDEATGDLIGFCLLRGLDFYGCDVRRKTIRTHGTYVVPAWRERDVAQAMLLCAGNMAKLLGYDQLLGMTMGRDYTDRIIAIGARFPGTREIGRVFVKDLQRKSKELHAKEAVNDADMVDATQESDGVL